MSTQYRYRFGNVVFDESKQELVVGGLVVDIQRRPLQILSLLLSRGGEVVTRDEFFTNVWEGRPTVENVLANAITKLRNVLGPDGGRSIENVPRLGYRFAGEFARVPVARALVSRLDLSKGQHVPLRRNFVLEGLLAQASGQEVWVARDPASGERRVYKFAADAERIASLKREVTLSRLLHDELDGRSDIVRVLGWNFDVAPCFIESEFGGEDLLAWAAAEGRLAQATRAERLGLLLQVADAVAAAHRAAVLHKDLKPENILISRQEGGGWRVRLTDFGSARLLEPERLSELGITSLGMTITEGLGSDATRGTLMYLAPELLAEQPATVRSDIYSLGVLLYQLLVGDLRRAMGPGWERDIDDELLREDIAHATDGKPALRAGNVQEWADGLRRLEQRHGERLEQRAAERTRQLEQEALRRARTRRPWIVATLVVLAVGLCVTLLFYIRVRQAQVALTAEYAVARALNTFLTKDFIAAADPTITGRKDVTVVEAARKASASIDPVFSGTDPAVRSGLHATMQVVFHRLSDFDASVAEGRKALEAMSKLQSSDPRQVADIRIRVADALAESDKLDAAGKELEAVGVILRQLHAEQSALGARYWSSRAGIDLERLALPRAVDEYRHAMGLARRARDLPDDERDTIQFYYADALKMGSHFTEASREAGELLTRQRARLGAEHPVACYTSVLLASILGYTNAADAIPTAQRGAACLAKTLGTTNIRTASAYQVLADLEFQSDHYGEAAIAYGEMARTYRTLLGPQSVRSLNARMNAGVARQYSGDAAAADVELGALLQDARAALGWKHPMVQVLRYHLADCRLDEQRTSGVQELLAGLAVSELNSSQIEPDWDGRLAYEEGRLALYSHDRQHAISLLETAAKIIAAKHPDGRVTEVRIRRLIQDARGDR